MDFITLTEFEKKTSLNIQWVIVFSFFLSFENKKSIECWVKFFFRIQNVKQRARETKHHRQEDQEVDFKLVELRPIDNTIGETNSSQIHFDKRPRNGWNKIN